MMAQISQEEMPRLVSVVGGAGWSIVDTGRG